MKEVVEKLYDLVWSKGILTEVEALISPTYTIYSDPGDAWEGQTFDREIYRKRVLYSRTTKKLSRKIILLLLSGLQKELMKVI